jgi:hypothetical protein
MEQHLRARPELLPAVLTSLFELVLFEDVGNQWSLSRPMLALILVNEDIYLELQRQIIAAQPADRCLAWSHFVLNVCKVNMDPGRLPAARHKQLPATRQRALRIINSEWLLDGVRPCCTGDRT